MLAHVHERATASKHQLHLDPRERKHLIEPRNPKP
jgi:hypothetical protein